MLDSTAKLNDIITALQEMEGINQKADLKSALVIKGISVADTDTMADLISKVNNSLYGSNIKSIQRGTSAIGAGVVYINVSISTVDLTKSIIKISYKINSNTATSANATLVMAKFLNSSTIELSRINAATPYPIVEWEVIEFQGIKSLQSGTLTTTSNSQNVTISGINTSKSELYFSYNSTPSDAISGYLVGGKIVDSTTLNFSFNNTASNNTITWFVVEYN